MRNRFHSLLIASAVALTSVNANPAPPPAPLAEHADRCLMGKAENDDQKIAACAAIAASDSVDRKLRASAYFEQGRILGHRRQFTSAQAKIDKSVEYWPENPMLRLGRVQILSILGDYQGALAEIQTINRIDDSIRDTFLLQGQIFGKLYNSSTETNEQRRYAESAREAFRNAHRLSTVDRDKITLLWEIAFYDSALNQLESAIEKFEIILHYYRNHATEQDNLYKETLVGLGHALYMRGLELERQDYLMNAMRYLDEALNSDPDDFEALFYRSELLSKLSLFSLAEEDLNRAIALQPDNSILYFYRGIVREQLKHYDSAKTDYRTALTLNPKNSEASTRLDALTNGE